MSDKFSISQLMQCKSLAEMMDYFQKHRHEQELLSEYQRLMETIAYIQDHEKDEDDPNLVFLTEDECKTLNVFFRNGFPKPKGELAMNKGWPKVRFCFDVCALPIGKEYEQAKKELERIAWRAQFREFLKENGIESPA